jgi:ABC-type glycerol-3-phosphate transport system substrate-binding protein
MRTKVKLALSAALLSLMVLALAACGSGSSDGGGSDTGSTKPSDVSGTLTVWDIGSSSVAKLEEATKKLNAEFEKAYPNVKLEYVQQPLEGYVPLYQAAFTAHEGPDVMMMVSGAAGVLSYTKGLEVLNDRISPELDEQIINWSSVIPGFENEGDKYGVPVGIQGLIFYYNKKLFARAGLPTDFEPQTWEEVVEAGEKLKAAGIQPFTGGNKGGYENGWWFTLGAQSELTHQEAVELAEGERPLTDEAVAKAFGPEIMIEEAGLYPDERFTTPYSPDGVAAFGEGKGAMSIGFTSGYAYWGEYDKKLGEKNVGMFSPPHSSYLGRDASYVWSIPTFARNKDAAWAFIEFMSSAKSIETVVDVAGELPNRKDVPVPPNGPEQLDQIIESQQENPIYPTAAGMLSVAVLETMQTEINQVLQGRTSLEDAQKAMQEALEKQAG